MTALPHAVPTGECRARRPPGGQECLLDPTRWFPRFTTSPPGFGSSRSAPPPRLAAAIRPPAVRRPTSSRRCSSPRCASTRSRPGDPDNDRFVLSKGHAAPLLYAAWAEAGAFARGELLTLAADWLGPRGSPDAAAALRGRRDRLARPGPLRGGRHRAQRAPHRLGIPHLRAASATASRPRGRCGRPPTWPPTTSSRACAASPTSTRSARAGETAVGHDMEAYTRRWEAFGWHAIVVDGHDIAALLDGVRAGAPDDRPADHDPRADDQGEGRVVRGGTGRLARPAAQEGRGGARASPNSGSSSCRRWRRGRGAARHPAAARRPARATSTAAWSRRRRPTSSGRASPRARRTARRS